MGGSRSDGGTQAFRRSRARCAPRNPPSSGSEARRGRTDRRHSHPQWYALVAIEAPAAPQPLHQLSPFLGVAALGGLPAESVVVTGGAECREGSSGRSRRPAERSRTSCGSPCKRRARAAPGSARWRCCCLRAEAHDAGSGSPHRVSPPRRTHRPPERAAGAGNPEAIRGPEAGPWRESDADAVLFNITTRHLRSTRPVFPSARRYRRLKSMDSSPPR